MEIMRLQEQGTGLPMRQFVRDNIFGQFTMFDIDGHILATIMGVCEGDHIEVGVLHGGSIILCAYAKGVFRAAGHLYGIDPFKQYHTGNIIPPRLSWQAAQNNIELHNMEKHITIYEGYHPPLPPELQNHTFASAFIDGNHEFQPCLDDWLYLKDRVKGMIAFHDVHNPWGANTVFQIAVKDPDWEFAHREGKMGVVKRKDFVPRDPQEIIELLQDE